MNSIIKMNSFYHNLNGKQLFTRPYLIIFIASKRNHILNKKHHENYRYWKKLCNR